MRATSSREVDDDDVARVSDAELDERSSELGGPTSDVTLDDDDDSSSGDENPYAAAAAEQRPWTQPRAKGRSASAIEADMPDWVRGLTLLLM